MIRCADRSGELRFGPPLEGVRSQLFRQGRAGHDLDLMIYDQHMTASSIPRLTAGNELHTR